MDVSIQERINILIDQCIEGDMNAFGEIYDLTINDVKKAVYFLFENKQDVEDMIHEIYLEVYKSLKNYNRSRTFSSWLTGVAIRQIHNYRRRNWKLSRLFQKVNTFSLAMSEPDIANMVVEQMDLQKVMEQIQKLPFNFRSVLLLKYIYDYSQDEIAEILQLPIGTVKSRLHHALKKARTIINRQIFSLEQER
ncbi:sigma-70 family RNA polymerase sigma factor [Brevibacillus centrosporus]|uniref:sigma-70 family RNA polymerase sigma factor n=1 Tax=Brevibacillus centrosporus TaxID=54910 RepID=UPI003D1AA481